MQPSILEIVALGVSAIALIFSIGTYLFGLRQSRRQATLEAYNRLQAEALDELYSMMPADIREISANRRSAEYKHIRTLVARIEHFSVGVTEGIYDRKTVYALAHGFLDGTIKLRVEALLEVDRDHKNYYRHINQLYTWMKKKSKDSHGKSHGSSRRRHHSHSGSSTKTETPAESAQSA